MDPVWLIISLVAAFCMGLGTGWIVLPSRRRAEVDRTKTKPRPLNPFDAYSDKELRAKRADAAKKVKTRLLYKLDPTDVTQELRKIDDEIEARKIAKLALEKLQKSEHDQYMEVFNAVYDEVLRQSESKEPNQ